MSETRNLSSLERIVGCLLGGAVGDALGAPIEFLSLREIRKRFGPAGLRDYALAYGRIGAITDDTQMTLFTAEGLIEAHDDVEGGSRDGMRASVHRAYLRWLSTQGVHGRGAIAKDARRKGDLVSLPELHSPRAPGNTCLSALRTGRMGTRQDPLNDSKGCGGIMRVAPAAVVPGEPFELGCDLAAITHGHPSGYLPAGVFALTLASILSGTTLRAALDRAFERLRFFEYHQETLDAVNQALHLVDSAEPCPEVMEQLGGGWVAEVALAISLFCALTAPTFEDGVLLAVNHGGDSDSTGALTGNLLGVFWGLESIPGHWLEKLELRHEIEELALELHRRFM